MNDLTITVLEMLWFGLISGGIIVFAINYLLTQKAIRIKKNGYLILLTIEINDHLFWIKNLYTENHDVFVDCILNRSDVEWHNTKYYLAGTLKEKELFNIQEHYIGMSILRVILKESEKTKSQLTEEALKKHIEIADLAYKTVYNLSNAKILVSSGGFSNRDV